MDATRVWNMSRKQRRIEMTKRRTQLVGLVVVAGLIVAGVVFFTQRDTRADQVVAYADYVGDEPSDLQSTRLIPAVSFGPGKEKEFVGYVDAIFYGTPSSANVVRRDRGEIHTVFEVSVERTVKGSVPSKITVDQIGGILGRDRHYAIGVLPLEVGEKALIGVKKVGDQYVVVPDFGSEPVDSGDSDSDIPAILRAAGEK